MVCRLKMPDALTGPGVETHNTLGEQIVAQSVSAVVIVCRCTRRQIYIPQLFVCTHERPDVDAAAVLPRLVEPGLHTIFTGFGDRPKCPQQLTGANVVTTHITWRPLPDTPTVLNKRPDNDDIFYDQCRRVRAELEPINGATNTFKKIDLPSVAEVLNQRSALGIAGC